MGSEQVFMMGRNMNPITKKNIGDGMNCLLESFIKKTVIL